METRFKGEKRKRGSVQFRCFFVRRVFFAAPAVFGKCELIRSIELVAHGNVIGRFTDRTYHSQKQPLFFFCHTLCYYSGLFLGKKGGC